MDRRKFIKNAGAGTVASLCTGSLGAVVAATSSSTMNQKDDSDEQILFIGDNIAVADTQYGKVKGYVLNGVYTFLGIPYGADTSGKNRFMPPQAPESWSNIRPAVFFGDTAPQNMYGRWPNGYGTFTDHWNYFDYSENCLMINVWTPGLADDKKRPVLVWLHGGGFIGGSGIEQDGYHGENLSKYGDMVFCSINHRLGPFGFSDFSGVGGEKYRDSGNISMLDIIAALRWINTNITNFGGDPGNVTIMGQSGGGSKVCTIAAMPAAMNLVHKAVPLSGSVTEGQNPEIGRILGSYILREAGLRESEVDKLQDIPWKEYLALANSALVKFDNDTPQPPGTPGIPRVRRGFAPVADGVNLPTGIFYSGQKGVPNVPMLICSTFDEWTPARNDAALEQICLDGVVERLNVSFGDKSASIVAAYRKDFPDARPIELLSLILSHRQKVMTVANAKLKQGSPVYVAWYGWQPPLFDNRMRAHHCNDICFWFLNTDRMFTHTGGGARPRNLSYKMADALLAFMRTGNPNTPALPHWPQYTEAIGETMILNDQCEIKNSPDKNGLAALG